MPAHKKELERLLELIESAKYPLIDQLLKKLITTGNVGHILSSRVSISKLGKKSCHTVLLWVIGGDGKTDSEGRQQIDLNALLCESQEVGESVRLVLTGEPIFVPMAKSNEPVYLTTIFEITETPLETFELALEGPNPNKTLDIVVNVHSWDEQSNAKPYVNYQWNCLVEGARLVNVRG